MLGAYGGALRAHGAVMHQLVQRLHVGPGAGLDDVGAGAATAVHVAVVLHLHRHFAQGVFAAGDRVQEIAHQLRLDAGDPVDGPVHRIHRPVAGSRLLQRDTAVEKAHRGRGQRAGARRDVQVVQHELFRNAHRLFLDDGLNVAVGHLLSCGRPAR